MTEANYDGRVTPFSRLHGVVVALRRQNREDSLRKAWAAALGIPEKPIRGILRGISGISETVDAAFEQLRSAPDRLIGQELILGIKPLQAFLDAENLGAPLATALGHLEPPLEQMLLMGHLTFRNDASRRVSAADVEAWRQQITAIIESIRTDKDADASLRRALLVLLHEALRVIDVMTTGDSNAIGREVHVLGGLLAEHREIIDRHADDALTAKVSLVVRAVTTAAAWVTNKAALLQVLIGAGQLTVTAVQVLLPLVAGHDSAPIQLLLPPGTQVPEPPRQAPSSTSV